MTISHPQHHFVNTSLNNLDFEGKKQTTRSHDTSMCMSAALQQKETEQQIV